MQLKYLIFIYFISILFPQKYNHQEPIYFSIKENKNYEMMDIIIPSIIKNQIETDVKMFNIKDKSIFYFKLIKDNNDPVIFDFIENSNRIDFTIFIIDLNNNGWIGPYKVDNYSRFLPEFSDRIKSSNILIEVSIPINNKFEFPIENIFTPNEKPKFNKNKKLNKSYFKRFSRDHRRNVLLVGYWPPSNESIREFSKNESLNPNGWVGENWENHGFDVLSYFPTFEDSNCFSCGQANGSFQVDYQNTTNDWWNVVDSINPIAIITLSRGNIDNTWELEHFYDNWNQ